MGAHKLLALTEDSRLGVLLHACTPCGLPELLETAKHGQAPRSPPTGCQVGMSELPFSCHAMSATGICHLQPGSVAGEGRCLWPCTNPIMKHLMMYTRDLTLSSGQPLGMGSAPQRNWAFPPPTLPASSWQMPVADRFSKVPKCSCLITLQLTFNSKTFFWFQWQND